MVSLFARRAPKQRPAHAHVDDQSDRSVLAGRASCCTMEQLGFDLIPSPLGYVFHVLWWINKAQPALRNAVNMQQLVCFASHDHAHTLLATDSILSVV